MLQFFLNVYLIITLLFLKRPVPFTVMYVLNSSYVINNRHRNYTNILFYSKRRRFCIFSHSSLHLFHSWTGRIKTVGCLSTNFYNQTEKLVLLWCITQKRHFVLNRLDLKINFLALNFLERHLCLPFFRVLLFCFYFFAFGHMFNSFWWLKQVKSVFHRTKDKTYFIH